MRTHLSPSLSLNNLLTIVYTLSLSTDLYPLSVFVVDLTFNISIIDLSVYIYIYIYIYIYTYTHTVYYI